MEGIFREGKDFLLLLAKHNCHQQTFGINILAHVRKMDMYRYTSTQYVHFFLCHNCAPCMPLLRIRTLYSFTGSLESALNALEGEMRNALRPPHRV